jgi:D-alanyl-D-alanine carboxypeptidase
MKQLLTAILGLGLLATLAGTAAAQGNPRDTAKLALKGKAISVEYGRPSLKGRSVTQMLEQLKPGDVWRLGADKSTTLSTAADLVFSSVAIPTGDYSLWARREADNTWKLVFNKQHGQWGTKHDAAQDLAAVPLKETKAAKAEEMVTINLAKEGAGGVLAIQWGDMKLTANFKAK